MAQLCTPESTYASPYPAPLHDEFAWHIVKYLHEDVTLDAGTEMSTPSGFHSVDFLAKVPSNDTADTYVVAFEIGEGRDPRHARAQLRRDALLMATGKIDALYRLRGSDLVYRLEDVLFMASRWDPCLFSEQGRCNLDTLASWEAKVVRVRSEQPSCLITYVTDRSTEDPLEHERHLWHAANDTDPYVFIRRLSRDYRGVWQAYAE